MKISQSAIRRQRGSSTTSVLIFSSVIAVASAAMISQMKDARKSAKDQQTVDVERRMNEAALQKVSQLINNGSIFFNPQAGCRIAEPQFTGSAAGDYKRDTGCGSATSKLPPLAYSKKDGCKATGGVDWRYVSLAPSSTIQCNKPATSLKNGKCEAVELCVSVASKDAKGKTVERSEKVYVTFYDYETKLAGSGDANRTDRFTATLRAQRPGRRDGTNLFFSSLKATVNFGAIEDGNKGLIGKYGATDTCFYMRPRTVEQGSGRNIGFAAKSLGTKYSLDQLEPRPDGRLNDEFSQEIQHSALTKEVTTADYAVLSGFRNKLISEYYAGANSPRGPRPYVEQGRSERGKASAYRSQGQVIQAFKYSGPQKDKYFVGVMPRLGSEGGPQFKHFLTGSKSEPTTWNPTPEKLKDYANGCTTSAKAPGASFCTRVDIPHQEYSGTMRKYCKKVKKTIPNAVQPPPVEVDNGDGTTSLVEQPMPAAIEIYADKAVQVSCDPNWVAKVRSYLNREKAALNNTGGMASPKTLAKETTLDMAISALEVDDEFLAGEGRWKNNPIEGESGPHPLVTEYLNFRAIKDANSTDGAVVVYQGNRVRHDANPVPKEREVQLYEIADLDRPIETAKYVSETCAYFTYYQPANASTCSFDYKTRDEESYVCRNHDGCFDELTLIRMADGTDRLVTQLKKGEYVYNPVTKKPSKIVKLTIGPELKPLINVKVGERMVRVTDTHPFMTRRGWVQAKSLKTSDEILSGKDIYLPVRSVMLGETGRTVANLALEGPADQYELHYVLADGVVTGDLVIQNMLDLKAANK